MIEASDDSGPPEPQQPPTLSDASPPAPPHTGEAPLSPRRERFCRYYLTEPSATRAAVKAGYSPQGAGQAAHRMLKNVEILQRIDALRRSEHLVYELSPQAVMDRCEAIFEEALEKGRFEAALGALKLQSRIGGLLKPDTAGATKPDLAGIVEYCVRTAVAKYVSFGTLGTLNPLRPPPWAPGEEVARRTRRRLEREVDTAEREAAAAEAAARQKEGWPPREGTLVWPGDGAAMAEAAAGHEAAYRRADGHDATPPEGAFPPEAEDGEER